MPTVGTTPFYNEIILSYTIAFYDLYALVELIFGMSHNLSEYGLSLIQGFQSFVIQFAKVQNLWRRFVAA